MICSIWMVDCDWLTAMLLHTVRTGAACSFELPDNYQQGPVNDRYDTVHVARKRDRYKSRWYSWRLSRLTQGRRHDVLVRVRIHFWCGGFVRSFSVPGIASLGANLLKIEKLCLHKCLTCVNCVDVLGLPTTQNHIINITTLFVLNHHVQPLSL